MAPQIPEGRCPHCQAPLIDLFAEWTNQYQTAKGKRAILAGEVVFDCYYCQQPLQLILPLALVSPKREPSLFQVAKRERSRCEEWLLLQHPGSTLSQFVEAAGLQYQNAWAFDGYNWSEGDVHHHGQDDPPTAAGGNP